MATNNSITKVIGEIMTDYGGTKWKTVSLEEFKKDVKSRLFKVSSDCKGPLRMSYTKLLTKLNKGKSVESILFEFNEVFFSFDEKAESKARKEYEKSRN